MSKAVQRPFSRVRSPGPELASALAAAALLLALAGPGLAGLPAPEPPAAPERPQAAAPAPAAPTRPGPPPGFGPPPADRIFGQACAACHDEQGKTVNERTAPALATLRTMTAEAVYEAMVSGKMQVQAAALSDRDMRSIAEYASGKSFGAVDTGVQSMPNRCASNPPLPELAAGPAWNGWSPAADNARFQTAAAAGLSADEVPRLKLKWAFGFPAGANSASQPSVVAGRVFVGSDNRTLYSLDARTGCAYWSFELDSFGRFAPIVAPIQNHAGSPSAVYFVTSRGTAYALDAHTGTLLWKRALQGPLFISASAAYHDGRLFVPITGGAEVFSGVNPSYECCKSRGAVVALDASSGELLWRTESIPEPLRRLGANAAGTMRWGPAGVGVWNTPTVDAKRGLLYVGTGNNYGSLASSTSDSILALRMTDGAVQWHHQEFRGDAFMAGCRPNNPPDSNCPRKLGPDWDFGGSSPILQHLADGRDVIVAAGKGGVAIALDPDRKGRLLWRTVLYREPPSALGLVLFGGAADGRRVYYPMQHAGGGLKALDLATGKLEWDAALGAGPRGQIGPASALPDVIFTGDWDGVLHAVNLQGKPIWSFDTRGRFPSVNGVVAIGGSLGSPGATIAGGMVFVASGYPGVQNGTPGNALLAFGVD